MWLAFKGSLAKAAIATAKQISNEYEYGCYYAVLQAPLKIRKPLNTKVISFPIEIAMEKVLKRLDIDAQSRYYYPTDVEEVFLVSTKQLGQASQLLPEIETITQGVVIERRGGPVDPAILEQREDLVRKLQRTNNTWLLYLTGWPGDLKIPDYLPVCESDRCIVGVVGGKETCEVCLPSPKLCEKKGIRISIQEVLKEVPFSWLPPLEKIKRIYLTRLGHHPKRLRRLTQEIKVGDAIAILR